MAQLNEREAEVRRIVAHFAWQYLHDRILHQAGQFVPGLDMRLSEAIDQPPLTPDNIIERTMEPQEWLMLARYGAGLSDAEPGYIYEICQSLAEWLFGIPDESTYTIPDGWYETPLGALWGAAFVRLQGDQLITLAEAAKLAGISVQALSARVTRGTLRGYVDPLAPERQGRRLVRRSDIVREVAP